MKPYFFLSFLIFYLLPYSTYSQPFGEAAEGFRIKYLDYENSSGEKGRTYFNYDSNDRLYRSFWTLNNKSRNSVNYYEHDAEGNITSAFRDFSDGLRSTEVFYYDSSGQKTMEIFHRSDSVKGKATYQYIGDKVSQAIFENYKGWLNGRLEISYSNYDRRSKANLIRDRDTICAISYNYDPAGNLIKETWKFVNEWEQVFSYSYETRNQSHVYYSSPFLRLHGKFRIKNENYSFNGESGGPSLYRYDQDGFLTEKEFIRSDSLSTLTNYKYDANGRLTSSYRNYSDGRKAWFSYSYDESNDLILRNFYLDNSLKGYEAYYYDQNKVLKIAYLYNFDNWITGSLVFPDDRNYRIPDPSKPVYAKFLGENGFDAEVFFQYDENEFLKEIKWEFSFGKYQLYEFDYQE